MTGSFRGLKSVQKLLRIARADGEALRIDLADIERAHDSAEMALKSLAEQVAQEEAAASGDRPQEFAVFLEGNRERRLNLEKTLASLEDAREKAREKLRRQSAEIAKLEHLIEINARDFTTVRRRREQRESDDVSAARR